MNIFLNVAVIIIGFGGDVSIKAGKGSGDTSVGGSILLQSGAGMFFRGTSPRL